VTAGGPAGGGGGGGAAGAPGPGAPDVPLRAALDAVLRGSPLLAAVGGELLGWGAGWARVRAVAPPGAGNVAGTVSGAVLLGLADAAFEVACNGHGRRAVALELSAHFASAGVPGEVLVATAEELSRSARTASYRIAVVGGDPARPRLVGQALAYRTRDWHLGEAAWPRDWVAAR